VEKTVISCFERGCKIPFIQTHLIGCTKEKNSQVFGKLIQVISNECDSPPGFTIPPAELDKIIHFKSEADPFDKTALAWASENRDHIMASELLQLEHKFHKTKEKGLNCLQENPHCLALTPWIWEIYSKVNEDTWFSLILVLLSRIFYFYDISSDKILAISYRKYSSEHLILAELCSCDGIILNSSCYERMGSDHGIQNSFSVAFWVTISLISVTISFYIYCIGSDSRPSWLTQLLERSGRRTRNFGIQQTIKEWCFQTLLICAFMLFWPFILCGQQMLCLASPKYRKYKGHVSKSSSIWNSIKMVENGVESSIQLLLQVWLLRPFLPTIMAWDTIELLSRCGTGLVNFFTFDMYPACYIEQALAKVILSTLLLSVGISLTRKNPFQNYLSTLPMIVSIFAQIIGRIVVMNSLVHMTTFLGYYALFFILHFLLVFLIKIFLELPQGKKREFWEPISFIVSGMSSSIVMIHLRLNKTKEHPSFLSHAAFQILILFENLLLVCLSRDNSVWFVIVAWIIGDVAQTVHYKYCTPFSELNGPHACFWFPPSQFSFIAILCWKKEIQRIVVSEWRQLQCKDNR
jgi:hypothetical protein